MINNINQYIFQVYQYLLALRSTLEYAIDRPHDVNLYNNRKLLLEKGFEPGTALGNFFKEEKNKEQGDKIIEKIKNVLEDLYSENSSIIKVTESGEIRVDHTQNIKLFDEVIGLQETIRDIVFLHLNAAKQRGEEEQKVTEMIVADERLTRVVIAMLLFREFQKSFGEFQKVVGEAQGKATPQSNFIAQNELAKLSSLIRFSRAHTHCIDNATLDLLDEVNQQLEMAEGRRERRDNKSFGDLFNDLNKRINERVAVVEADWVKRHNELANEMMEIAKQQQNKNNA